ncbi:MAG TPA: hypothetical protein VGK56_05960, partial [Anaerolineales bacterium]
MPDFSHVIPDSHRNVSPGFLEMLIRTEREELFTGLMRLSHESGEDLLFSFLEGIQQKLYRCVDGAVETLPRQTWQDALARGCARGGLLRLPVEAMRFMRVIHEAPVRAVEELSTSPEQLVETVRGWGAAGEPGIVHVQGQNISWYYLMAGASAPVIEELSIANGEVRFSLSDTSFPKRLPNQACHVVRYVSTRDHDAWREYELRLAFSPLMRMLISRFGELAGRSLTERLCEQMTHWAREGGWNVSLSGNGIVNRQYFDSLESAVSLYADLLRRFREDAAPAIGSRMADAIV